MATATAMRPANGDFAGSPLPSYERRRGRPRADTAQSVDEASLLQTAFTMFATQGYEAATMRAMARELGVSHNLLNVRFGRKSELWKAAVDWRLADAAREVEVAFEPTHSPEEQLRDLVHRFCRWAIVNSDIVAISQQEGREQSWRLDYLSERFTLPFQRRLQELLAQVSARKGLRPLGSAALLALLVHGVGSFFSLGPMHERLLAHGAEFGLSSRDAEQRADVMAEFLLAGLFAL